MIQIQRLSIEELEALEYCVAVAEECAGVDYDIKRSIPAQSALVKLRAVVPLPHRAGTAGDVFSVIDKIDQDYSLPPCAKDAPELPQ